MISAIFNQPNYQAAKKVLDATVLRQEAIASNLANMETPNYKRVDVAPTFLSQLEQALANKDVQQIASLKPSLAVDPHAKGSSLDGNTVQLEQEMMLLNQNAVAHSLETQVISGTLLRMRLAITGRPA